MNRIVLVLALAAATTTSACGHPGVRKGGYLAGTVAFIAGVAMITAAEGAPCRDDVGCDLGGGGLMTAGTISAALGAAALIALVATQTDDPEPASIATPTSHRELDLSAPRRPAKPAPATE